MSTLTQRTLRNFFDLCSAKTYKAGMENRPNTEIRLDEKEIDILLKYFPNGVCAFDLEMTGLSPIFDKIIEIAAVKLNPDRSLVTFHSLVNPLITIPEHTIKYHQLTNDDVREAPTLKAPLREFMSFYGDTPLVAHNALFDASFLIRGLHEYNFKPSLSDVFDSCKFARSVYKGNNDGPDNYKLSTLAEYYKFSFTHHQALDDALISLRIFARCLMAYKELTELRPLKDMSFLFKLNSFRKAEDYLLPNKLEGIRELVQTQTPFFIKYKGGTDKGELRGVKPVSILPLPQGLVLYAECLKTNLNKYFQVKKIQKYSLTEEN